jgi:hypothetical protein
VWWLGWDAGHAFDLCPGMEARLRALGHTSPQLFVAPEFRDVYRDVAYARAETEHLAEQLAAVTS